MRSPLLGASLLASLSGVADAQPPAASRPSCFDSVPPGALTRVVVYTHASLPAPLDQREQPLLASIDVFAQTVATAARQLLNAAKDELPRGEPALSWRVIEPAVSVTAYRDGRYRAEVSRSPAWSAWTVSPAGAELLLRAMDTLRAGGDAFFWDGEVPGDSIAFALSLVAASVAPGGKVTLPTLRNAVPTMTLLVPVEEPVRTLQQQRPFYPQELRATGYRGSLVMEYLVDSTGAVVEESMHDVWPTGRPRPTGSEGIAYLSFTNAVRRALLGSRYQPGRLGGCPIRQLVTQPFVFNIRR
jgi:hypothetical protein